MKSLESTLDEQFWNICENIELKSMHGSKAALSMQPLQLFLAQTNNIAVYRGSVLLKNRRNIALQS
jgi:hypothetical protein